MSHHQHINIKTTTAPATEPVTLDEAKAQIRVTHDAEDDMITAVIVAARQWAEGFDNRAYIEQTITMKLDFFENKIELPRSPLMSVTSINYIDTAGDSQLLSTDLYDVDSLSEPGLVTRAYGQTYPQTRREHHAVTIVYQAGYGATRADVPQRVKQALLLLIAHWYEHRYAVCEGKFEEVPFGVKALLGIDRCFA